MMIQEDNYIKELKRHNEKALCYVIDTYASYLNAVIVRHLGSLISYREECLNDVVFKIWQHIDQFDENRNTFKNWIGAVARYQAIDYVRKYLKDTELMQLKEEIVGQDMLGELLKEELTQEMEDMLACLEEKDKKLFRMLYVEQLDIEEIAADTGISKGNIYKRVSRGKKKIRELFEKKGGRQDGR